jgi:hypothetical protein
LPSYPGIGKKSDQPAALMAAGELLGEMPLFHGLCSDRLALELVPVVVQLAAQL